MKPPLAPMATLRYDRVRALVPPDVRTVLEIGCGQGAFGYRLATDAPGRTYLGLEPDAASCAVAQRRLAALGNASVRAADSSTLPAADQFDLVCAFEVLEHMPDDRATLAEWRSHVRPGGHLLVSVPAHAERYGRWDEIAGHCRRYDVDVMHQLLTDARLDDISIVLYGAPLGYLLEWVRPRLLPRGQRPAPGDTAQSRTSGSGRLLQPDTAALGVAIAVGVAPFRVAQRALPGRGVAMVARGRVPRV